MASILHQNSYNPADIYNMGRDWLCYRCYQSTRVLAVLEKEKLARKGAPGRQEWVTSIELRPSEGRNGLAGRPVDLSPSWTTCKGRLVLKCGPGRLKAMTEANIRAGWRSTGLYPFQPSRVIPDVPVPSTPPRQGSRLSQTPLASITREKHEFLTQYGDIIRTPVKNRLQELSSAFEAVHARNTSLEKEKRDFRDAQTGRKRKKAGVTVSNLETHVL